MTGLDTKDENLKEDPDSGGRAPAEGGGFVREEAATDPPVHSRDPQSGPGFLELIYGVLFDPVKTFRQMADSPPINRVVLIFSLVKILAALVGGYTTSKFVFTGLPGGELDGLEEILRAMVPALAVAGLVYEYIKWFVYSGLLYLLAELSGGRGRAVGVLAVTGLASLPVLLLLPIQVLMAILGGTEGIAWFIDIILSLAVLIWGLVLVVLGVRETQSISATRAVMVALTPVVTMVILLFVMLLLFAMLAAAPIDLFLNQMQDINF